MQAKRGFLFVRKLLALGMKSLWLILPVFNVILSQIPFPKPISGTQTLNHLGYTLSYNEIHGQQNWARANGN